MANISWTETIPSITSPVGQFPRYAQSVWTAIAAGMATEHYWDGSGGASAASRGLMAPGGSRAFFDVRSNSSAPNSQMTGRLFLTSDTSRLLVYDSTGTYLAGTPFLSENSTSAGTGYWVRQAGTALFPLNVGSASTPITFPIPFLTTPIVHVTTSDKSLIANALNVTLSACSSAVSTIGVAFVSSATVFWEALGTVSSASY